MYVSRFSVRTIARCHAFALRALIRTRYVKPLAPVPCMVPQDLRRPEVVHADMEVTACDIECQCAYTR
jgi:hypothetical protein